MKYKDDGYNRLLFGDLYGRELNSENINELIRMKSLNKKSGVR